MEDQSIQIPFNNFGKSGIIEVIYKENTSPVTSGFEIVKGIVPDLDICIGYPTIRASVKEFAGFGFSQYCDGYRLCKWGFILMQIVKTQMMLIMKLIQHLQ